jgi:hypothetical protein
MAVARPMPLLEPVTKTILSVNNLGLKPEASAAFLN